MAHVIFRGPPSRVARTINLPVTTAALPGSMVVVVGATLVVAVAADREKNLLILSNKDFFGQDVETVYTANETAVAYQPEPTLQFQVRLAADTYAVGDALSIGALGRLRKALTTETVIARFTGTAGAIVAGVLSDVEIANSFKLA